MIGTPGMMTGEKITVRVKYNCATCGKTASWVFKKVKLAKTKVFDTTYLRCEECYSRARAEAEQEFLDAL